MRAQRQAGAFYGDITDRRRLGELDAVCASHTAGSRVPRHAHERAYFCLTHAGAYVESYGRRKRRCQPGVLVFHPAGEMHEQAHETAVTSLNVEVSPALLERLFDCVGPLDQPVEFRGGELAALAMRLFHQLWQPDLDADGGLDIEASSWEILAACARRPERAVPKHAPRWLRDARDLLEQNFRDAIDLPSLARQAGVHPVHFAATFRRFFGFSVGEYRRRLRLEYVRQRLRGGDVPLATLALDAGFSDQSHLTREFKRFAGMTPSAYRESLTIEGR